MYKTDSRNEGIAVVAVRQESIGRSMIVTVNSTVSVYTAAIGNVCPTQQPMPVCGRGYYHLIIHYSSQQGVS